MSNYRQLTGTNDPLNGLTVASASAPTFADLDGDGDLDLVVGRGTGALSYFKNTGTATAAAFAEQTGGANPVGSVAVGAPSTARLGDLDGDGDLDLIVGNSAGTLRYFQNTGSATAPGFTELTGTANPLNGLGVTTRSNLGLGDIDGDGDLDLTVASFNGTFRYYRNTGTATAPAFDEPSGADNPFRVNSTLSASTNLADIDGDGDLDMVLGEAFGALFEYRNTGTATAPAYIRQGAAAEAFSGMNIGQRSTSAFGDIDGDGDLDLVMGNVNGVMRTFLREDVVIAPGLTERTGTANPADGLDSGNDSAPSLGDLDADGDLDLIVGEALGSLRYYQNTGTANAPAYAERTGSANPAGTASARGYANPSLVDIDSDGDLDIVLGSADGDLRLHWNTGTATAPAFVEETGIADPFIGIDVGDRSSPGLGDIDGDGDLDLIVGNHLGELHFRKNTGSATRPAFVEQTGTDNPFEFVFAGDSFSAPRLGDIDGDGDLDLVIGNGDGLFVYHLNIGNANEPSFAAQSGAADPFDGWDVGEDSSPTMGDLDSDGDLDVIAGALFGKLSTAYNTANSLFTNAAPVAVDDAIAATEDAPIAGNLLLANPSTADSDADGDALTVIQVNGLPANVGQQITLGQGLLTVQANGSFKFDPNGAYHALDAASKATETFTYTIDDSRGETASATVTITVQGANDAPIATPVVLSPIEEDSAPLTITQAMLLASASDMDRPAQTLVASDLQLSGKGTLASNGDGSWLYTPALNDDTDLSFSYTISDGTATVAGSATLDITPVNDAPTSPRVLLASLPEDGGPLLIDQGMLLSGAQDVDTPSANLLALNLQLVGEGQLIDQGNGTWSFIPAPNDNTGVAFKYEISDGLLSTPASATLDLVPVNDAPVANPDSAQTSRNTPVTIPVIANDTDVDGNRLSVSGFTQGRNGQVSAGPDAFSLLYTPGTGFAGFDTFTYSVTDGSRLGSEATVRVLVPSYIGSRANDVALGTQQADFVNTVDGNDRVLTYGGDDYVDGGRGVDTISGGLGADTLLGGEGADIFLTTAAELAGDSIDGGDQIDTLQITDPIAVMPAVFTLVNVEQINFPGSLQVGHTALLDLSALTLSGTGNQINGGTAASRITGTRSNDRITDSAGNDDLRGGDGNDTIMAGVGQDTIHGGNGNDTLGGSSSTLGDGAIDTFVFNTPLNALTNADTVIGFEANSRDVIALDSSIFVAIGPMLDATEFRSAIGGHAADGNDFILFDPATGGLYYDADGNGAGARVQFATLGAGLTGTVDAADFVVIGSP